ncbi:SOS response-associated peptidase [Yoonia maricola]|uniref:SOS response-associated peptidase n=1 Tax=Yoonia maricola TaxID=420999 RepID=UPI001FE896C9|nr:SOS response-associated peptidase [Yoonia maricola]
MIESIGGMDDPPRLNIAPGQEVIALTSMGVQHMRWGMIPVGRMNARGRPVMETIINARSETVFDKSAFADVKRAIVPASGWYEWTGAVRRKQPWRITRKDGALLYFAAIYDVWHGPGGVQVPQVATITCAPSADVRDIHHRMGVILTENQLMQWFNDDDDPVKELMKPFPDGRLRVEKADDVDWAGA